MSEWWSYGLQEFLLFSPRVYWRMFELHNRSVWPLQVPAVLLGVALLVWVIRPRPWSGRAVSLVLAAAWIWVAWSFLWNRYSTINWAASYAAPAFALEGLLLISMGALWNRLHFVAKANVPGVAGFALLVYALALHPFMAKLAGRPFEAGEVFGIAPDPTAIATLGVVSMGAVGPAAWLLSIVPLAWCIANWATLHAMAAPEAWIPLTSAGVAVALRLWPRPSKRAGRVA